ncbi:hypothetical protein STRCR_1654 [Streptococcus criceti HS-6]|uniref:Uncharacterized protein n=1 Tax=Streptococcus criceti HS-6 TaxID=873449 RepID=G5JPS1_STRCG|nr:hypothetical protein STRCR_1654 [Streptococcus criceti HS-6]
MVNLVQGHLIRYDFEIVLYEDFRSIDQFIDAQQHDLILLDIIFLIMVVFTGALKLGTILQSQLSLYLPEQKNTTR